MLIIGIGHRKLVGKDTFAKYLLTHFRTSTKGKNIQRRGFADKLKECAFLMYGWAGLKRANYYEEYPQAKSMILPSIGKSPRDIWITMGQHMRLYDTNVWLNANLSDESADVLIVPDLRFPIEHGKIFEKNGVTIKVTNNRVPDTDDAADSPLAHPNIKWDYHVHNDSGFEDLQQMANLIGKELLCRI